MDYQIAINDCTIGFNITGYGGDGNNKKQGIGSVSIVGRLNPKPHFVCPILTLLRTDSKMTNVPIGVLTSERTTDPPSIVLDNVQTSNVGILVKSEQGNTLLAGKRAPFQSQV